MSETIIQEYSGKIEATKQKVIVDFDEKVNRKCQQIDGQTIDGARIGGLKKAYLSKLCNNTDNKLWAYFLVLLDRRGVHFHLDDSFFANDNHLISQIDNDKLSSEFDGDTQDYIALPAKRTRTIQTILLSMQILKYCLVPIVSIICAVVLFWGISLRNGLFVKSQDNDDHINSSAVKAVVKEALRHSMDSNKR